MKKQPPIIIALVLIVAVTIIAIAWGTIALLRTIDSKKTTNTNTPTQEFKEEENPVRTDEFKEDIDEALSKEADAIANEAASLMELDPHAAQQKYLEAKETYAKAGNIAKATEMDANAMTAALLIEQKNQ